MEPDLSPLEREGVAHDRGQRRLRREEARLAQMVDRLMAEPNDLAAEAKKERTMAHLSELIDVLHTEKKRLTIQLNNAVWEVAS